MTKKQLVTWLTDRGIVAEGRESTYGYVITKVKDETFDYRHQNKAHQAAIHAFLEAQRELW